MKFKFQTAVGAFSLACVSSLLVAACGPTNSGSVAMKPNATRGSISDRALKSFTNYKSDAKLTESILGASAETAASATANGADVSVRLVLRGSGGELVALHGTALGVQPKERRSLTLDPSCTNPRFEIEISCHMENCGALAMRLIEKADASMESLVTSKIGPQRPDAAQYRQAGIVFMREGVTTEVLEQRKATRKAIKQASAEGSELPAAMDPKLKITPGPLKRFRTDRAGGAAGAETSFEAAVETLRQSKENISMVNACVDKSAAVEPAAPVAPSEATLTDIQPVDKESAN